MATHAYHYAPIGIVRKPPLGHGMLMDAMTTPPRPRAGRPTREQAEARHGQLLDAALDHFLDRGFDQATVEAIATSVNMTKRTVYALYPDKVSLFRAAVHRAIEALAVPPEELEAAVSSSLEDTLAAIAWTRISRAMTEQGLKLQRVINSDSYRFPDIFMASYEKGAAPVARFLAQLLRSETAAGRLAVDDPEVAAGLFLSMVVTGPVRLIVSGNAPERDEIDRRLRAAVDLFLNGTRPRNGGINT